VLGFFLVASTVLPTQHDFIYSVCRSIVNKGVSASDVSASRRFAHYYSDKVAERTKWSIFVQGR
jgi:hypothetical protein